LPARAAAVTCADVKKCNKGSRISGNTVTPGEDPTSGVFFTSQINSVASIITGNQDVNLRGDGMRMTGSNNITPLSPFAPYLPADTIDCDPGLMTLANNGGPTQTMALPAGSRAIDKGPVAPFPRFQSDQRGPQFARKVGAATDVGAYEAQSNDRIFYNGFNP